MKKLFVLLIGALFIGCLLFACGKADNPSKGEATISFTTTATRKSTMSSAITTTTTTAEKTTTAAPTTSVAPPTVATETKATSNTNILGGDTIAYTQGMGDISDKLIPPELMPEVDAWFQELWAKKPMIDFSEGSLYDFVHTFNISESDFRERNKELYEPYSEESINDLYKLSKKEFIDKYASDFVLVKDESMISLKWITETGPEDWAQYGVTKEDVALRIERLKSSAPELAKEIESLLSDKLN